MSFDHSKLFTPIPKEWTPWFLSPSTYQYIAVFLTYCFWTFCYKLKFILFKPLTSPNKFSFLLLSTAVDNCTIFPLSDPHISYNLWSCFSHLLSNIWFWQDISQMLLRLCFAVLSVFVCLFLLKKLKKNLKKVTLHWNLRIINCLHFDNSDYTYCNFLQANFDNIEVSALQKAQECNLQSYPLEQGKLPCSLSFVVMLIFMLLHAANLYLLNLRVRILQTEYYRQFRDHNQFF